MEITSIKMDTFSCPILPSAVVFLYSIKFNLLRKNGIVLNNSSFL